MMTHSDEDLSWRAHSAYVFCANAKMPARISPVGQTKRRKRRVALNNNLKPLAQMINNPPAGAD
jgi:hypothetical protein